MTSDVRPILVYFRLFRHIVHNLTTNEKGWMWLFGFEPKAT